MWIFCITDGAKPASVVPKADNGVAQWPTDADCGVLSFKIANGCARMRLMTGRPAVDSACARPALPFKFAEN